MSATFKEGPQGDMVLSRIDGPLGILTLNRPGRRNCLSREMMAALMAAFQKISAEKAVKVIILAAEGPAFCSGHDLKEMQAAREQEDGGRTFFDATFEDCSKLMQMILTLPQPVIAQVQGIATAAGCQLVATCDLAVTSEAARFATPGVNLGLFCSTPMVALSRNVSRKAAMGMLLTGEPIDAEEALRIGLVNRLVAPEAVERETRALASQIAEKSGAVVAIGKEAFYAQAELPIADAYAYTAQVMTYNMMKADAEEGIGAFLGKRKPQWPEA